MAGGFGNTGDEEIISGINVTPLVDVVLVLLIIFMITAPVIYQSAIKVQLPAAKTGEGAKKTPLDFAISKEGQLFWNKDPINWTQLEERLKSTASQNTNETAVISADRDTSHGMVVKLMDLLRQHGLTHFALNVESK